MNKKLAVLLGLIGVLAVAQPSHAATAQPIGIQPVMLAGSDGDVLKPIPNATALLRVLDAERTDATAVVTLAQYHQHYRDVRRRRRAMRRHYRSEMSVPAAQSV